MELDAAIQAGEGGAGAAQWRKERQAAVRQAELYQSRLKRYDIAEVLAGDDVKAQRTLLGFRAKNGDFVPGLLDQYSDAVGKLDAYGPTGDMGEWAANRARYADIGRQAELLQRGAADDGAAYAGSPDQVARQADLAQWREQRAFEKAQEADTSPYGIGTRANGAPGDAAQAADGIDPGTPVGPEAGTSAGKRRPAQVAAETGTVPGRRVEAVPAGITDAPTVPPPDGAPMAVDDPSQIRRMNEIADAHNARMGIAPPESAPVRRRATTQEVEEIWNRGGAPEPTVTPAELTQRVRNWAADLDLPASGPIAKAADGPRADWADDLDLPAEGRDLRAPRIGPETSNSQLAAFARQVQDIAANISNPSIDNIFAIMRGEGKKAPVMLKKAGAKRAATELTPERLREMIAEAEQAGYLATTGPRNFEVPYLGMKVGEIVEPPSTPIGDEAWGDPKKLRRARFNWEDRGARPGTTYKAADGTRKPADTMIDMGVPTGAPPSGQAASLNLADRMAAPAPVSVGDSTAGVRRGAVGKPADATPVAPPQPAAPRDWDAADGPTYKVDPEDGERYIPDQPIDAPINSMAPDQDYIKSTAAMDSFARSTPSPMESFSSQAANKLRELLDELHEATAGQIGKRAALDAAEAHGLSSGPRGALSETLAGVVGLRRLASDMAVAVKGGTGAKTNSLLRKMGIRAGAGGLRQAVGSAFTSQVAQSAVGGAASVAGGHLVAQMFGMAGAAATAAGKGKEMIVKAGNKLLGGNSSRVVGAAVSMSVAYSYGDAAPTSDVLARVQQLHAAVANPERTRQIFLEKLGDLSVIAPEIAQSAADNHVRQLQGLSLKAPRFVFDALGQARLAGTQDVRRFREAEDATWRYEDTIRAIANKTISRSGAESFRASFPLAAAGLVQQALQDPARVGQASRETRQIIGWLSGMPLTHDGQYAIRQQASFQPPQPVQPNNVNLQAPAPTPAQAAMAPGNN